MSETTETTPAPEPEPTPTPAPDQPAPDTDEPGPAREADEQRKEDRRTAALRARLGAAERLQEQQHAELEFYRRQVAAQAPQDDTPEQAAQRMRMQIREEERAKLQTDGFHAQGQQQFSDWKEKCDDLVAMGADAGFARLLVEMPGGEGVRVVAALANDPDAVQRISRIETERGRAIALGKYAATIEAGDNGHARTTAPAVTRAPAPIRPVTGRASPQFNEYTASGDQLVERYMRQNLERQQRR
ncbi:MAG TPA: hypothetical protein VMQ99_04150 [Acetobacteraceae bacterium]|nr:hypothetical protein [Acetobacteraceae bacterium]